MQLSELMYDSVPSSARRRHYRPTGSGIFLGSCVCEAMGKVATKAGVGPDAGVRHGGGARRQPRRRPVEARHGISLQLQGGFELGRAPGAAE